MIARQLLVLGLTAISALAGEREAEQWRRAKVDPKYSVALDKVVALYQRHARTYEAIEALRKNGVPATILVGLHYRESTNDFARHLHEGSPLTHRTRYVPKGRPPGPPPFTFMQSAEDAYYDYEHLERKNWSELGAALDAIESFNGMGYRNKGVPSPYLWSGTDQYQRGKYVADGRYDPLFQDKQLGVVAILLRLRERGVPIPFR